MNRPGLGAWRLQLNEMRFFAAALAPVITCAVQDVACVKKRQWWIALVQSPRAVGRAGGMVKAQVRWEREFPAAW